MPIRLDSLVGSAALRYSDQWNTWSQERREMADENPTEALQDLSARIVAIRDSL